ncbi:MAG: universal stress protein [Inquilinus sp.]|nr:universal stress protein [Inquilinus sp.]
MKSVDPEAETPAAPHATIAEASMAGEAPILLAVDFSEDSGAALNWACDHAAVVGAPLVILHVVHDPANAPGTYKPSAQDPLEPNTDVAERKLVRFLERMGRKNLHLPVPESATLLCVEGLPAPKIVEIAQDHGAGLLVLGSGSHNGLERFVRGSTAHKVARHAQMPVTIVRADSQ